MLLTSLAAPRRRPFAVLRRMLSAYWKLGEATGAARLDSTANHNGLTNNNNCAQVAGKIGFGTGFVAANSQSLSVASNATLQTLSGDIFAAGWFNLPTGSLGANQNLIAKGTSLSSPSLLDWFLVFAAGGGLRFGVSNGASFLSATTGSPTVNVWSFGMGYFDAALGVVGVSLNGGAFVTTSGFSGTPRSSTAPVTLNGALGVAVPFATNSMDAFAVGKLSAGTITARAAAIRDALWNGGNGVEIY
jgi:hypothetical protein